MPFIKEKCPQCGKVAVTLQEIPVDPVKFGSPVTLFPATTFHILKCGHVSQKKHLAVAKAPETIISEDGKVLFKFQCDGVRFVEKSGGRALIGDEMGLGKTIQALATLILHLKEMTPFIWIGKSSLVYQYQYEMMRWGGDEFFAQVIRSSKDKMLKGFPGYIVSYDLMRRLTTKDVSFVEKCLQAGVKTVILDECQQIKNSDSQRTVYTRALCKAVNNVIALSGTPIKNHAGEFFTILNILNPQMFPRESAFIHYECDSYYTGFGYKVGGLRDPERFKSKTSTFIIRREREEVMPDLPKIQRNFQFHDQMSEKIEKAYIAEFKQFRYEYNKVTSGRFGSAVERFEESSNILAFLSRMRHLVGLAKIDPCIDNVMEFLGSTNRKLTIFHHHKDVGEILVDKLKTILKELELSPPMHLIADLDAQARFDMVQDFTNNPKTRILVASTLASGEGLNLQVCSDCIMLERQWNPANEEQAESRFPRPGSTASSISATYLVCVGTVDEFFSEIVERKREIVTSTLGGEAVEWDQSSIMKELTSILASTGGKRWQI